MCVCVCVFIECLQLLTYLNIISLFQQWILTIPSAFPQLSIPMGWLSAPRRRSNEGSDRGSHRYLQKKNRASWGISGMNLATVGKKNRSSADENRNVSISSLKATTIGSRSSRVPKRSWHTRLKDATIERGTGSWSKHFRIAGKWIFIPSAQVIEIWNSQNPTMQPRMTSHMTWPPNG